MAKIDYEALTNGAEESKFTDEFVQNYNNYYKLGKEMPTRRLSSMGYYIKKMKKFINDCKQYDEYLKDK